MTCDDAAKGAYDQSFDELFIPSQEVLDVETIQLDNGYEVSNYREEFECMAKDFTSI